MINLDGGLAHLEQFLLRSMDAGRQPIVIIDGRAGSGKTRLALELQGRIFEAERVAPRVLHMDDLYSGWEGLAAGSRYLVTNILQPFTTNRKASWQIWNWSKSERGSESEPGNGWREFEGGVPLIIEGCGSLSRASREMSDFSVWVESEYPTRRERLRVRDGSKFDEFWPTWAIQEDEFYQAEKSQELADLVISN